MKENKRKPSQSVYSEYLDFLKNNNNGKHPLKDAEFYLNQYSYLKNMMDMAPCIIYLLNFQTGKYLYMSEYCKNLCGFTSQEIMKEGLGWSISRMHPDDAMVYSNKVFKKFLGHAHAHTIVELKKTRFSFNWRFERNDGVFVKFLQQYVILEQDKKRNPILTMGVITDITAHKPDNRINFSISKYDEKTGYDITLFTDVFNTSNLSITKRENEVIKLIAHGYGSKQIADKLNVSLYTIKAHRRNLIEKTKCKNAAELGSYAITNGLI